MLRDPLHSFLQSSIQLRKDATRINRQGLFLLWCFLNNRIINLPHILLSQLATRSAIARRGSPILGGHFVTALAKFYRVDLSSIKYPLPPQILTYSHLRSNHLIDRNQSGFLLPAIEDMAITVPEHPVVHVEALSEDEDQSEDEDPDEDEDEDPSEHEVLGGNGGEAGGVASNDDDEDVVMRDVHMHRSPPPLNLGPIATPLDERVQGLEEGLCVVRRHQEIDASWQAGVLLSICRHFNVPLPAGYEYPYAYDPAPAFARPPGRGTVPPTDP
ncbi:hypothetical protein LXL04_023415 [Taraxacum kok-saghyz]